MYIKSKLISSISIVFLLATQTAHADFRKALDAYQKRDGATMLKEVQDAVDKKNDDELILFISTLQLDNILSTCDLYVGVKEQAKNDYSSNQIQYEKTVLQTLISENEMIGLLSSLEQASNNSTFDAQYEYLLLRYGDAYLRHNYAIDGSVQEKRQKFNRDKLLDEMKQLANKGYGKAAFYLSYPQTVAYGADRKNSWYYKAKQLGYQVEFNKEANGYIPTLSKNSENIPILSIQRYSNWASTFSETNYFLDIYSDGDVNFSRGILADIPKNKQRVIQKLNPNDLDQLIKSIKKLGFDKQPLTNTNGFGDNMGNQPSFGGYSITRTYLITLRENDRERTLIYNISEEDAFYVVGGENIKTKAIPAFFSHFFKLLEKNIPTQLYRCGVATKRDYYQHCITRDF